MAGGAPGASSRGRGGKFKKFTRGKQFSRNLQPVDDEGNAVSMWSEEAQKRSSDEEDSSSSSDEESGDEKPKASQSSSAPQAEASREDRKAQKKARKEAAKAKGGRVEVGDMPSSDEESDDDDDNNNSNSNINSNQKNGGALANPNHSTAARKQIKPEATVEEITEGVKKLPGNRREREAAEAAAAKERYMRLSAQGKTDTAKADLARLKLIREQREAEAARRQAEKEERDEQDARRRSEIEAREAKRREAAAGPKKTIKKK